MEIGIDIGTSYSSVAVLDKSGAIPVKSDTGQCAYGNSYSIPSAVYAKDDGTLLIGQAAVASRMIAPSCFKDCFKRDFGSDTPFLLGSNEYITDQLYIEFFRHFKQVSERLTGEAVTNAYITHPANYTEYKKHKLKTAAVYGGLSNIRLIDEPTAAALSYFDNGALTPGEKLLIYDFGGGTFDLALVMVTKSGFEPVTEPLGLEHCGGVDFDHMIYDDMIETLSEGNDLSIVMSNIKFRAMLSEQSIKIKHTLSYDNQATISIPFGFDFLNYSIDRQKYNRMISHQVQQTCELTRRIAENAGIRIADIDKTLCVGGTTRTPFVIEMLEKAIGKKVYYNADPELAICCGAAAFSKNFIAEDPVPKAETIPDPPPNIDEPSIPILVVKQDNFFTETKKKFSGSDLVHTYADHFNSWQKEIKKTTSDVLMPRLKPGSLLHQALGSNYNVPAENISPANLSEVISEKRGNTVGNLANGGRYAYSDGWIYLNYNLKLYKISLDSITKIQITDDIPIGIQILDGWLYYSNTHSIKKVNLETAQTIILATDENASVHIVDDWIYYANISDQRTIYKIKTDTTNKTKVTEDSCWSISVNDSWIYYTHARDDSSIYRICTDGTQKEKISSDRSECINPVGDWLYYLNISDNCSLYKMIADGSNRMKLNDVQCSNVNVYGDWIFFKHANKLYRMNSDGSNVIRFNTLTDCDDFGLCNDWIYYYNLYKSTQLFGAPIQSRKYRRIRIDGTLDQPLG